MPKKLDDELMEYKRKIGEKEFKLLYAKLYQEGKNNRRFSCEHYTNTEDKINAIKNKYKKRCYKRNTVRIIYKDRW